MPFTIHKEVPGTRYVKLLKTVHITADGRPVDESDTEGKTLLGVAGSLITEDDAKKYNLDESHVDTGEIAKPSEAEPAATAEAEPEKPDDDGRPKAVVGDKVTVGKKTGEISAVKGDVATSITLEDGTEVTDVAYTYVDPDKAKADADWQKKK